MVKLFEVLAFLSAFILFYIYIGYFIILFFLRYLLPEKKINKKEIYPNVSLLISCYNEEAIIREKLENSLALDYPKDQIEIIVISDSSTDRSDEIVKQFEKRGVRLIRQAKRMGKTLGLNLAVPQAKGEIIVFSDANAMYHPDAIGKLVRSFYDPKIGYVVGESRYQDVRQTVAAKSESIYWQYEILLKQLESRLNTIVGGDGAMYAIRRELYEKLVYTDINDFVNPLQIVLKGFRGVYEPEAISWEETTGNFKREFQRKVRIVNRSFSGLLRVRSVLNPFKTGFFSLEVFSHKLLRWLSPVFVIIFIVSCFALSVYGMRIFEGITIFVIFALWLSYFGYLFKDRPNNWPIFYYPYYFVSINIASLIGLYKSLRGNVQTTWKPFRSTDKVKEDKSLVHGGCLVHVFAFISVLFFLFIAGKLTGTFLVADRVMYWSIAITCCLCFGCSAVFKLLSKNSLQSTFQKERMPQVTLLIYAFNEEEAIGEKIKNSFELDYPHEKLKIVIASDGSFDGTNEIVRQYKNKRLNLRDYPVHRGKREVISDIVSRLTDEIIILSDANTLYQKDIIRNLIGNFADPSVLGISNAMIIKSTRAKSGRLRIFHSIYGRFAQKKNPDIASTCGLNYRIYAFRREMMNTPNIILDDFVTSVDTSYSSESYSKKRLYK